MPSAGHRAQRTCLGCRQSRAQDQLVRYVLSPAGEVLVDYRRKLPGRGAYTCVDTDCVAAAVKGKQFERAFRGRTGRPDSDRLAADLVAQLRQRIEALLGMARKSGVIVTGSNMVLAALPVPGRLALVLMAEDIADGIASKVSGKAEACEVPCFRLLDKALLGQLTGKGERSVVAFRCGALAESIHEELLRYMHSVGES